MRLLIVPLLSSVFFFSLLQAQSPLADLTIDAGLLKSSLRLSVQKFSSSSCAVQEGCVAGPGKRKLLHFAVATPNVGEADLVLGNPADHPELFVYSPCHMHYHFQGYALYELLDSSGVVVLRGRKQAFCLADSLQYQSGAGPAKFTCDYQGISVGWADVYGNNLDCQWLDVTALRRGTYTLRVTVNPDHALPESNYDNNTAEVPVTIK